METNSTINVSAALATIDPEVHHAMLKERERQEHNVELIASENATFPEVMEAQGSVLTNKYAEGYPNKRYYGGCIHVDEAETLAIDRAKALFNAEAANVQPHSGSTANMAVFMAVLKPGAKLLGMSLDQGGHLTHGSPMSFSGKIYEAHAYGIDKTSGRIDYNVVHDIAKRVQPKLMIAGASTYSRTLDFKAFRTIADDVGAVLLVDMAHIAGLVAAGLHPSPIPYADYVTTTTHKTLRGPRGGLILTRKENLKKINSAIFPGIQGGPLMHVIAAKAVAFKLALQPAFKTYQEKVIANAQTLGKALQKHGFDIVSGGTDNHMLLVSLLNKNISGKLLETALELISITVNKNTIPDDPRSPVEASGIRLGTPLVTTRGMGTREMEQIAGFINTIAAEPETEATVHKVRAEVRTLTRAFPLYSQ